MNGFEFDPVQARADHISECYRMIQMYIRILNSGYSVGFEEIQKYIEKIMEGGRTPARADAPAGVPTNADCKTS